MGNLLTKKQAAEFLNVSTRTVNRYVELRGLKAIRLSSQTVRFEREELERFINEASAGRFVKAESA